MCWLFSPFGRFGSPQGGFFGAKVLGLWACVFPVPRGPGNHGHGVPLHPGGVFARFSGPSEENPGGAPQFGWLRQVSATPFFWGTRCGVPERTPPLCVFFPWGFLPRATCFFFTKTRGPPFFYVCVWGSPKQGGW